MSKQDFERGRKKGYENQIRGINPLGNVDFNKGVKAGQQEQRDDAKRQELKKQIAAKQYHEALRGRQAQKRKELERDAKAGRDMGGVGKE